MARWRHFLWPFCQAVRGRSVKDNWMQPNLCLTCYKLLYKALLDVHWWQQGVSQWVPLEIHHISTIRWYRCCRKDKMVAKILKTVLEIHQEPMLRNQRLGFSIRLRTTFFIACKETLRYWRARNILTYNNVTCLDIKVGLHWYPTISTVFK